MKPTSAQVQQLTEALKVLTDMVSEFTHGALNDAPSSGIRWTRLGREEYEVECVLDGWDIFRAHIKYNTQERAWKYLATKPGGGGGSVEGYEGRLSAAMRTATEIMKFGHKTRTVTFSERPELTLADWLDVVRSEDRRFMKSEIDEYLAAGLTLTETEKTDILE